MTNQTEVDLEKQFLADIEKATALSLETKAMDEFKRNKINYSQSDVSSNRKTNTYNISMQDYQKILNLRKESYERKISQDATNRNYINTSQIDAPTQQRINNKNSSNSINTKDLTEPDLISFTSPTTNDETHTNFVQMCDEIHRLSLQANSPDISTQMYATHIPKMYNYPSVALNANHQVGMQLVPYTPQTPQPTINVPLTPDHLNKLYNMNPGYAIPRPIPNTSQILTHQNYSNVDLNNPKYQSPSTAFNTHGLFHHPVGVINQPKTHTETVALHNFQPLLEKPILREEKPSNNVISKPSSSVPPPPVHLRKNKERKKSNVDNLIDFGSEIVEDSRVSVLEAFDPLLLADLEDDKDDVSSEYYYEYDPFDYLYSGGTQYSDPVYEAVNKTEKTPLSPSDGPPIGWNIPKSDMKIPPPLPPRNSESTSSFNNEKENAIEYAKIRRQGTKLYESVIIQKSYDPELISFYKMVLNVRSLYRYDNITTNVGHIVASEFPNHYPEETSIKLIVHPSMECFKTENFPVLESNGPHNEKGQIEGYSSPVLFTCDITTSVEHVVSQVFFSLEGHLNGTVNDFMLKPIGVSEWLRETSKLSQLECVHNSIKLEKDVQLGFCPKNDKKLCKIGRTLHDDIRDNEMKLEDILAHEPSLSINYDNLMIILETIETEIDRLETTSTESNSRSAISCSGVIQAIKAICSLLGSIETIEISEASNKLKTICSNYTGELYYGNKMDVLSENGDYAEVKIRSRTFSEQLKYNCNEVRQAIEQLLKIYSHAFRVNFCVNLIESKINKSLANVTEPVMVHVTCLYRLPPHWKYDDYLLGTQIYHGTRYIGDAMVAQCTVENLTTFPRLKFKAWLCFENIPVCILPREARLVFVLYGCTTEPSDGNSGEIKENTSSEPNNEKRQTKTELGWFSIQFFDFESVMINGSYLLPLWPPTTDKYLGPAPAKGTHPHGHIYPVLGIEIPDYGGQIFFPDTSIDTPLAPKLDFNSLDKNLQQELIDTAQRGYLNVGDKREVLWEKRYYLQSLPYALPKVLHAAHSWDFASLVDLHSLIKSWNPLTPIQALELLLPRYPDLQVRSCAVAWISKIPTDQLVDYLPQLVQALKHDTYEASALSQFLLSRSLESPRIAHHLYWLLVHSLPGESPQNSVSEATPHSNINETIITQSRYHRRNQMLLRALLATCGEKLSTRFISQNIMCKNLADVAQYVKQAKESHRQKILVQKLEIIHQHLLEQPTTLPLGPGLEVTGVNVRSSSYFNSNTLPLKINFIGPDREIIPAIFKCGDDLQQDMLTLQLVRMMDKLWLKDGLDLKIVTFNCIPTGDKKGIIELISDAETLRKIQVEWGLTGSFKDKPIAEWLARQNPSQLEYQRAVDNFTVSCAGYSVATYILGICDRHNDNIMLKTSGHLFHIDFGKFLGDAQMFGNFKRDRTPFVLTSDMAYVINGGEKPSTKFHNFVDLCCQAFNIVRKHGDFLLHMLALMATSGIPGVTADSVNYVRKALLPGQSNPEAAASFAKMIHISLKSWFTQFNFFLHNLAQLRFTSEEGNGELLSFVPRTFTMAQDGRLKSVTVHGYQKRYELEKYYTYILKVTRQNQPDPSYLFRSYKEFLELHQKLCLHYPLAKLHSLPSGLHVGRSHIKTVADRRLPEIQHFLISLFNSADEIAHSDLVYTFFHPILRDQQEANIHVQKVKAIKSSNSNEHVCGQIKFSLQYIRGALTVMIHHARSLPVTANGQEPNTYVKCYLKPDHSKATKRKTKVVKKNCFPTFMETLEYRMPLEIIQTRTLEVTVWSHDSLQENEFLGGVILNLCEFDLHEEILEWFTLSYVPRS